MSHVWSFSPSSEALLQRLRDAAAPLDENNRWVREFKENLLKFNNLEQKNFKNRSNKSQEVIETIPDAIEKRSPENSTQKSDNNDLGEGFFDILEAEPIARFDHLMEESQKNSDLFVKLAERLSEVTVEKICNHIFKNNLNNLFIDNFYKFFLPAYLKRQYSWLSLDLLVKAKKSHPLQFNKLLNVLLKDLEIPCKVLQDFVLLLNEEEKDLFLIAILEVELDAEEFIHNIFMIYAAYKDNKKTDTIQNYIIKNLVQHGPSCTSERDYGRLLLAYLQSQNSLGLALSDYTKMERIIEMHQTPFKKPCLTVFKENLEKYGV